MNILICAKHVPDTTEISLNSDTNWVIREGVTSGINLLDKNAVEAGLKLKEEYGGTCTVLTLGVDEAIGTIREAIAMGVDEGVLVSDERIKGSDSLATAKVLAAAIKKTGQFDVILLGRMSTDGNTGQLASQLAQLLNLDQLTFVQNINEINNKKMIAEKVIDGGYMKVEIPLPAVVSVEKSINEPRYPSIKGTMKANRKKVPTYSLDDLELAAEDVGSNGAKLTVEKFFEPPKREKGEIFSGEIDEVVDKLIQSLQAAKAI